MTERVSAIEAFKLMREEGYLYLDVRSVPEFEANHPEGAYNVPLREPAPGGMVDNADFIPMVSLVFAKSTKMIVGCAAGVRSLRACELLEQAGFVHVIDQRAGTDGVRDPFGRVHEPGWNAAGLPSRAGRDGERGYDALRERIHKAAIK